MTQTDSKEKLASFGWEVAHCPHFEAFDRGLAGVCSDVIESQGTFRRPPEGWTGRVLTAPIIFVTSNPNTDVTKPGSDPLFNSPQDLAMFNDSYFDSHAISGARSWQQMQKWASDMLGRQSLPGSDFGLTDAVRCASPRQLGVDQAISRCSGLYLGRLFALTEARVVAFCGKALIALTHHLQPAKYRLDLREGRVVGPIEFYGRDRLLVGLRHPADVYHGSLQLSAILEAKDVTRLVCALA